MKKLLERARAYLAGLEADRQTALALSEQKAEEAKLIKPGRKDFTRCWHCSAKLLPVTIHRERTESLPLIPAAAMIGQPSRNSLGGAGAGRSAN